MKNVKIKRLGAYHHHKVDSSPKINNGMLGFFERKKKVDLVENKLVFDIEKNNWTKTVIKIKLSKRKVEVAMKKLVIRMPQANLTEEIEKVIFAIV